MPNLDKACFDVRLPIAKLDSAKGLVTGWAALSTDDEGEPVFDYQDEHAPLSELQKAAESLMLEGGRGKAGEMHTSRVGDIVESMVIDADKAKALGFGDTEVEGWAVTLKLRDPAALDRVKKGERSELSIHGLAKKTPIGKRADGTVVKALSDLTVDEISIVDQGASGNENSQPRIVIAKRKPQEEKRGWVQKLKELISKQEPLKMTLDEAMAMVPEDARNIILAAMEQLKAAPAPAPAPAAEPVAMQAPGGEENKEEIAKALAKLPEPVRKRFEELEAEAEERAELKKRIDKMEQDKEFEGFVAKAKSLPFLAGKSTQTVAKALRSIHGSLEKKDFDTVIKLLESADTAVKKSRLFEDAGSPFGNDADDPESQLQSVAKSLMDKDPKMSAAEASVRAAEMHQDLYAQRKNG